MVKPIAFIDADIILYRAVSFVDTEFDGETQHDVRSGMRYFNIFLEKWLKELGPYEDYFLVLSVGRNFRKGFFPDYKANRKDIEPHPIIWDLKDQVKELQAAVWEEGIEADDYIGIRCSEDRKNHIAVSADKDFQTVPCRLMIPSSHQRTKPDWYDISEESADLNWLRQAMTGDVTDNYKGIVGVGPKKAEAILPAPAPLPQMWAAVEAAFLAKGMTREDALTMARLARILRAGEYNFETKEVTLWTPPNSAPASASAVSKRPPTASRKARSTPSSGVTEQSS